MHDLIVQLLLTLKLLTGYDVQAPEVVIVSSAELSAIACHGGCSQTKGVYVRGAVYMADSVDVETAKGRSDLFHELVHHAQASRRGEARDCWEWVSREYEAYALQNRYLHEIEHSPVHVYFSGTCRDG